MKQLYSTPQLHLQNVHLGVFGDYNGDSDGSDIDVTPIKVIERVDMRLD